MPVIFGPSTELIPNGYDDPKLILVFGTLNTGDSITWSVSGTQFNVPHTTPGYHYDLWTKDRALGPLKIGDLPWGPAQSLSFTAAGPTTFQVELYIGGNTQGQPPGTAFNVTVSTTIVSNQPCTYGTEKQPGAVAFQLLSPVFVEELLLEYGAGFLLQVLAQVFYQTISSDELCGSGPPPLPSADQLQPGASFQTALQTVQALLWPKLCRCKAGTPAPIPFPPPVVGPDPGFPPAPTFPCDNVDPCAALVNIQKQLAALAAAMGDNLELTTLLQRYRLPFAYIPGAIHRDVSVTQSFPVSRLAGVKVSVTAAPAALRTFSGLPQYVSDLGWLSLVTADGLIDEIRLTRQEQVWLPALMPLAIGFGITVREGVTVDWQELEAEP